MRKLLVGLIVLVAAGGASADAEVAEDVVLDIVLRGALFRGDDPSGDRYSLLTQFEQRNGIWLSLPAVAGDFNAAWHSGRVDAGVIEPDQVELKLSFAIKGDPWVPGGRARYAVTLKPTGEGDRWEGAYEGTFRGVAVSGKAVAARPKLAIPDRTPATPGEHPRLLFRKSDLPALKKKFATEFGRKALARNDTAQVLALKYQLTGDRRYAEKARKLVAAHVKDMGNGSKMIRSRVWGWRLEQMATAYDMCYDAWDAEFRKTVADHMTYAANRLFHQKSLFHAEIGWDLTSTYPGQILYGASLAGLALHGEKGPEPPKPVGSYTVMHEDLTLPPDEDYKPAEGVPVVNFRSGKLPGEWIYAAGFKPGEGEDPLEKLGGVDEARPSPGDKVACRGREQTFRPFDMKKLIYSGRMDITNAADRIFWSTSYFYTVMRNDAERWVRVRTHYGDATIYLNGRRLRDKDIVKLAPGLYPMMVRAGIGETTPWGKHLMKPVLTELSGEEAAREIEHFRGVFAERVKDWEHEVALWKATGRANREYMRVYRLGDWQMYLLFREAVGTGGFQNGAANPMLMEGPNRYELAHRNVFGRGTTAQRDVELYLPRKVFSHLYPEDGKPLAQDINGETGFMIEDIYHETRDTSKDFFAAMVPYTPEKYKPAMLTAWRRFAGAEGPGDRDKLLRPEGRPYPFDGYETLGVYTFLSYPLEAHAAPLGEALPLNWAAPDTGWYAFRNAFDGAEDFLVQVYAKDLLAGGSGKENAGTLRVMGLGQRWCEGNGNRFGENVVQLPEDVTNLAAAGRTTYRKLMDDGSGVVSIDLDDVYASAKTTKKGKPRGLYERYGSVRLPSHFEKTGITGMRSVAVDYSGKSGAPCLLVLVDRIDGGGKRTWTWQLDAKVTGAGRGSFDRKTGMMEWQGVKAKYRVGATIREEKQTLESDKSVTVDGNAFTLHRGDATLRGTFVTPSKPALEFAVRDRYTIGFKRSVAKRSSKAIFADAGPEAKGYFVVMTIQRGQPPEVKVSGKGLDATVTVGRRTLRFDGEKIVLE